MEKDQKFATEEQGKLWIDPMIVLRDVLKRWTWILLAAVAVVVGAYIVSDLTYEPEYKTSVTFVVTDRDGASTVYSHLQSAISVAEIFEDLLNSNLMREKLLPYIDDPYFNATITSAAIPQTNLLTVTVSSTNPRTAFQVMMALINHHEELTYQVVEDVILEVLQQPRVPMAPSNSAISSGQLKKLLLIAVGGAGVAAAAASVLSNRVRSGGEARAKLDCAYLGEIPHERKYKSLRAWVQRKPNPLTIKNPLIGFGFTESIRKLRRRVEQRMEGRRVLMVTSLLEHEGKSTVSTNLALAMARKQERVLLIDCDLRKPACCQQLGQHMGAHGLRDVLTGKARLEDALFRDTKSGLYLLLERRGDSDAGELLAGKTMRELIRWARSEFDCVILDLPPLAAVSDAECVAEYADAAILVVRQNVSDASALNRAISRLDRGKAKLLGCVLNDVHSSGIVSGSNYGYGYGYGYGGYGKYGHYGKYGKYGKYGHYGNTSGDGE